MTTMKSIIPFLLTASLLCCLARGADVEKLDLEPVWSAHPVGFCLLTHAPYQFAAYYDAQRRMSVAQRTLDSTNWTITKLPSTLGWDSHNYVTMALDRDGYLHVSGNMHCVPLVYFRGGKPLDAASLAPRPMTGDREQRVTYPVFLRDKAGRLIFRYRDGRSGSGDDLYNVYDEKTGAWSRLLDTPLMSGQGKMNAYASVPRPGPDGRFHVVWVWRNTGDCATNHDLSYARSDDLVTWTDSAGKPLTLPITVQTGEIVDPAPPHGGLINGGNALGFDSAQRPVITYHKYDANGDMQIYAARREAAGWKSVQVSDWKGYRWEFSGGGSISAEVHIGPVEIIGDGRLSLAYRYGRGAGTWVLDEATLQPIPGAKPPPRKAAATPGLGKVESPFPGMQKKSAGDIGTPPPGRHFLLTWESLPPNRDHPRTGPLPDPVMLRLIAWPAKEK
jgi:BNR repeat-containing family member